MHLNIISIPFQPEDTATDNHRKEYVNMKQILWHKSMEEIISSIILLSAFGMMLQCGDGITQTVFPHILMLSADYEEQ